MKRKAWRALAAAQAQCGERPSEKSLPRGTYVQVLETVPAERVLAVLAHHLSTAFVAFDVNPADWALLNGGICICPKEGARSKADEKLQGGHGKQCLIFCFIFLMLGPQRRTVTRAVRRVSWV